MEVFAAVLPVAGIGLVGGARRAQDARGFAPALFATFVASAVAGFVAVSRSDSLGAVLAGAGAAIAAVGIAAIIFWAESHVSLPGSASDRWRRFEHDFWEYVGQGRSDHDRSA